MPAKRIEFELPEPEPEMEINVEPAVNRTERVLELEQTPLDMEDAPKEKETPKEETPKEEPAEAEVDIEIVSDVPEEDRGKEPSEPAEEPTEQELEGYSERVKRRVKHLTKSMHDQRRWADEAERQREEALRYAKHLTEENQNLQQTTSRSKNSLIAQAKQAVAAELSAAQAAYKTAYEAGDADKIVDAQTQIATAAAKKARIDAMKPETLQAPSNAVQTEQRVTPAAEPATTPKPDPRLQAWMDENSWFGSDEEMTGYVYGVHNRLKREGMKGNDPEYYKTLDAAVRKRFPEEFEDETPVTSEPKKKQTGSVVAPVSRSTAPKKFKLTDTQVAIAKQLGVPLERYAKQAAILAQKENG